MKRKKTQQKLKHKKLKQPKRQTNKQKREKITVVKNILRRLLLILWLVLLTYFVFFVYQSIKNAAWDRENNFNFVVQTDKTFIFSYHPQEDILNILELPNALMIKTIKGYGEYQLGNIFKLGEIEKTDGGELLQLSLQHYFMIPVDAYLVEKSKNSLNEGQISNNSLERGRLLGMMPCLLTKKCQMNLSWWDLIGVSRKIGRLKFNQVRLIKLEESLLFKKERLADNSEAFRVEESRIDDFIQRYFTDKEISNQDLKISVINAAGRTQLAKKSTRLLTNIGARVINTQDATETEETSTLHLVNEDYLKLYTVEKIKRIFKIEKIVLDEQIEGDLQLVLGKDSN